MANLTFERVSVWETFSRRRELCDAEGAARWLLERWPKETVKPRSYGRALKACLAALNGSGSAETAREALIKAVDDAGLLDRV